MGKRLCLDKDVRATRFLRLLKGFQQTICRGDDYCRLCPVIVRLHGAPEGAQTVRVEGPMDLPSEAVGGVGQRGEGGDGHEATVGRCRHDRMTSNTSQVQVGFWKGGGGREDKNPLEHIFFSILVSLLLMPLIKVLYKWKYTLVCGDTI